MVLVVLKQPPKEIGGSDSVLYIMLLVNIMIYVAIAAYLFSREYTERDVYKRQAPTGWSWPGC